MKIPFTKAHGARNDFLLSWYEQATVSDYAAAARAICDRHAGVGADGWLLVGQESALPWIRLLNSDGSEAEISGNGTRCAAAFLIHAGVCGEELQIRTGAGVKSLRLLSRSGPRFEFEMDMGRPILQAEHLRYGLPVKQGVADVTILDVGNPQCAVFVENFDFDWRALGAEIERHPLFPNRTNVSFVRVLDAHAIDVRFFERGAGETMSSGTGSTGAMAAAVLRGLVKSPVTVETPAGPLRLRWDNGGIQLVGPAELIATGEFWYQE